MLNIGTKYNIIYNFVQRNKITWKNECTRTCIIIYFYYIDILHWIISIRNNLSTNYYFRTHYIYMQYACIENENKIQ